MNDKLQYATMLEIPVNTCNITYKPPKKRRGKKVKQINAEAVKEELLNKINAEQLDEQNLPAFDEQPQEINDLDATALDLESDSEQQRQDIESESTVQVRFVKARKKKFKFSVIGVQLAIIGALIVTIFLTNALYADSGINVFLRGVFGSTQQTQVDDRQFDDFAPVLAVGDDSVVSVSEGVMTFSGEGSVYSPCDGKITSIAQDEAGKYTIEITHSANFKSVLAGIDYAYVGLDDTVYGNIPVGYVNSGATMCFKSGENVVISDYQIVGDTVIWAV